VNQKFDEMMLIDSSKGFWAALSAYLSTFSWVEVFAVVSVVAAEFALLCWLALREFKKNNPCNE